jgi:hypothetical protein
LPSWPEGFLKDPPKTAKGRPQTGRFVCSDIQWTGNAHDLLGTFTITARELLAAAESNLLWTDQDVQRGVKPECSGVPTELSLAEGYPSSNYIFISENADEIAEKLLEGRTVYLNPLVWNLRPGKFEAFFDAKESDFHLYSGKIYLPDSHHRHQGLLKAAKIFRENPSDYPNFSLDKQFKIDLYFLSRLDEGNYFFDKNQRPRQTAKSKAFDLTTQDVLSLLAKSFSEKSRALKNNVNRVTDRLTSKNPQVVTLSTLREMSRALVREGDLDESEVEGLSQIMASFYDMLSDARCELAQTDVPTRVRIRRELLVDSAVMMHGYAGLMRQYMTDMSSMGSQRAMVHWKRRLNRLIDQYRFGDWSGDLFAKENPIWANFGIVKPSASGGSLSQVNNGATRSAAVKILRSILSNQDESTDLANLTVR